jgi:hypothetical protein
LVAYGQKLELLGIYYTESLVLYRKGGDFVEMWWVVEKGRNGIQSGDNPLSYTPSNAFTLLY